MWVRVAVATRDAKKYRRTPPYTAIEGTGRDKSSRNRCTKGDKQDKNRYAGMLLETIDGVYEVAKSCKVLSVEVDQESRKMSKFRFVGFGRLGFG